MKLNNILKFIGKVDFQKIKQANHTSIIANMEDLAEMQKNFFYYSQLLNFHYELKLK